MKRFIITGLASLTLFLSGQALVAPSPAYAACPKEHTSKGQVLQGIGETGSGCDGSKVTNTIAAFVEILSIVAGIVAIIMIIISGFRYITSGGEASKVAAAKSSLIYALVGLAVAALAQVLVRFVLFQTSKV